MDKSVILILVRNTPKVGTGRGKYLVPSSISEVLTTNVYSASETFLATVTCFSLRLKKLNSCINFGSKRFSRFGNHRFLKVSPATNSFLFFFLHTILKKLLQIRTSEFLGFHHIQK